MKLIIASNNKHKLIEIKAILGGLFEEIVSMREAGIEHETLEDGSTFMENAVKKAKEIAEKARGGADFDALIAEYNEDPGMTTNPDGYVFAEGTMVDEFYEGTKALAENAVSDPIKTSYGWHVILRLPLRDADYTANQTGVTAKRFAALAAD